MIAEELLIGNIIGCISEVTLCRASLVLIWVMVCNQAT